MNIDKWIEAATVEQLQQKIAEYEASAQSWSGRDNEMIHKLMVRLRCELGRRVAA